ncbi:hypothetical protein BH11BAC1_BH11BAC1_09040 [soil metagenome]
MNDRKNIFGDSVHLTTGQMLNYLRHNISREEKHLVERHITDCEFCSDALEGLKKLEADASMLTITAELQKMARKRKVSRRKLFSQFDLISVFAVVFLILFLIVVAVVLFWKR